MDIVICGISYKTAPVEMIERFSCGADTYTAILTRLLHPDGPGPRLAKEAILLSTCNRVELYAVIPDDCDGPARLARYLAEFHNLPFELVKSHIYTFQGEEAVDHLFSVASGLDSMILGEPQILGQVRTAFEKASRLRAAGAVLSALFRHAIQAGKRVHTETAISQRAASVSYAAVELAERQLGMLGDRRVLVVGAGKTGRLTAECLLGRGVRSITVANRTYETAVSMADAWHGRATTLDRLEDALAEADIAISATNASGYLIGAAQVRHALAARPDRPLLLIDIAVPRDVDPDAAQIPGVQVYNLDDLNAMVEVNVQDRGQDRGVAETIVAEEAADFMAWFNGLAVTPAIVNLREHAESIRRQELERIIHRLDGLSNHDRAMIELLTQRIVNHLLHEPTVRLKRYACNDNGSLYVQALDDLFALTDEQRSREAKHG